MNSREKGKRGERQWRDELRANGYTARRGQQFAGSPDSPDVVCEELDWIPLRSEGGRAAEYLGRDGPGPAGRAEKQRAES